MRYPAFAVALTHRLAGVLCVAALAAPACVQAVEFTIDLRPPSARSADSSGPVACIGAVRDQRLFLAAPRDPSDPSLPAAQLGSAGARARAIGRQRGSMGWASSMVMLPEGRTVEGLVREVVAVALAHAGYKVSEELPLRCAGANALDVVIERFWASSTPRPLLAGGSIVEFRALLALNGEAITQGREVLVTGYAYGTWVPPAEAGVVAQENWARMLTAGVADLTGKTAEALRPH